LRACPRTRKSFAFRSRVAGTGSLGRPRYVAVAFWRGGHVLREAKALAPSAWTWANGEQSKASHFLALANGKYRAPDPFLATRDKFILRRIAADSLKIELVDVGGSRIKVNILQAMGFDLASIHAAATQRRSSPAGRSQEATARLAERRREDDGSGRQARLSGVAKLTEAPYIRTMRRRVRSI